MTAAIQGASTTPREDPSAVAFAKAQETLPATQSVAVEVVALGETMVLFWPAHGDSLEVATSYARSCGGAESNFCIALARLGHRSRWISRLGDDAFGRYIRTTLEREGVHVDAPTDATAPTAVFFKERVAAGRRRVLYYRRGSAGSRLAPQGLRPRHLMGAHHPHL